MGERESLTVRDFLGEIVQTSPEQEGLETLFPGGTVRATYEALYSMKEAEEDVQGLLDRHLSGDWGDVSEEETLLNNMAITAGQEILSAYRLANGVEIWIVTNAARTFTTVQLPEENEI